VIYNAAGQKPPGRESTIAGVARAVRQHLARTEKRTANPTNCLQIAVRYSLQKDIDQCFTNYVLAVYIKPKPKGVKGE
jgi:hypothetical protein